MRLFALISVFLMLCCVFHPAAWATAQGSAGFAEAPPAAIQGEVLDENGPVSGASVRLLDATGTVLAAVEASEDGSFRLEAPRSAVWAQASTSQRTSPLVKVVAGRRLELSFGASLQGAAPGDASELQQQVDVLKAQMSAIQEKLAALTSAQLPSAPVPPTLPQEGIYGQVPAQSIASQQDEQAPEVPGRGRTEKGLYQGLAAGAPGERYGRGLFGDKVRIGGYGSFRYEANNISDGPAVGNLPVIRRGYNSFDFRRFVLTLDAAPADRLRVYSEIEFERLGEIEVERTAIPENRGSSNRAGVRFIQEVEGQSGSELAVEQAWAQYDFTNNFSLRMGVILPPVGRFNILHDDDYWDLPRRPLVDRGGPVLPVKAAWSELGAGVLGNVPWGDGYVDYQFYVVNGARLDFTLEEVASLRQGRNLLELEPEIAFSSGPFNGTDAADAVTWRVAISPKLGHELAFSGYHGKYTPDYLNVDSSINSLGIDGKTSWGSFEMEGEFIYTDFGRMMAVLNDIARQAVDVAAETSGSETSELESEVEAEFAGPFTNQRYGFWIDFKYRMWPRFLRGSFLERGFENPQLIPIFRFERIWFNDLVNSFEFANGFITDLDTENLQQQRTTLGLSYRPSPSVVMTAAWENNRRISGSRLISPDVLGLGRLTDKSFDAFITGLSFGF